MIKASQYVVGFLVTYAINFAANAAVVGSPRFKGVASKVTTVPESATFPRISVTLHEPDKVFQRITSRVADFDESLHTMNKEKMATIADQEARYEKELQTQHELNTKLLSSNARIARDKVTLAHRTSLLRQRAREVIADLDSIRSEIYVLRTNMTTAREFLEESVDSTNRITQAPELQVLLEFDEKDEIRQEKRRRADGYNAIISAGESNPNVAMLQVSGTQKAVSLPAEDSVGAGLLEELQSKFESLQKRLDESSASLKGAFLHDFKNGTEEFSELLQEHDGLNSSLISLQDLESELVNAVHFLAKKRTYALTRLRSMRLYMKVLSNTTSEKDAAAAHIASKQKSSKSKTAALLQIDGQAAVQMNHRSYQELTNQEVTSEPAKLFRQLTTQVGNFDRRMRNVEQERVGQTVDKQLEYEASLIRQRKDNLKLANLNSATSYHLGRLVDDITKKRRTAMDEQKAIADLRAMMKQLCVNLSLSLDFASTTLNMSNIQDAPELKVLSRLDQEDAKKAAELQDARMIQEAMHPSYLFPSELAGSVDPFEPHRKSTKTALLAFETTPVKHPTKPSGQDMATDILHEVRGELEKLKAAHVDSDSELEQKYEHAYTQGTLLQQKLMAEQHDSNRTLVRTEQLKLRVDKSVEYLSEVEHYVQGQISNVQDYLLRLSQFGDEVEFQADQADGPIR